MLRLSVFLCLCTAPLLAQNGPERLVTAGVYAEDQAIRGDTVFQMNCAACHASTFHTGEQFRFSWFGRTLFDYFKVLKTTMPEDNIGGLTDDQYTRVIAYILKLNGYPAGADSLQADSVTLAGIRIGESTRSP